MSEKRRVWKSVSPPAAAAAAAPLRTLRVQLRRRTAFDQRSLVPGREVDGPERKERGDRLRRGRRDSLGFQSSKPI